MSWLTTINNQYEQKKKQCEGLVAIDGLLAAHFTNKLPKSVSGYASEFFDVLAVLSAALRDGHTCLFLPKVANTQWFDSTESSATGLTLPNEKRLNEVLTACLAHMPTHCFVYTDQSLYFQRYWQFEQDIVSVIAERFMCSSQHKPEQHKSEQGLSEQTLNQCIALWPSLFPNQSLDPLFNQSLKANEPIADQQQVAALQALKERTLVINGGPGTGKTYTAARVLSLLGSIYGTDKPLSVKLAAPTGKAAQRLTESLLQASLTLPMEGLDTAHSVTLHRLLGIRKGSALSQVERDTKMAKTIHCDVLLVDEASMIDTALLARLLRGLQPHTRLILLGDANQLPSVEAGNVLHDIATGLADSQYASALVTLHTSRRFSGELSEFASACLAGNSDEAANILNKATTIDWQQAMPNAVNLKRDALSDFSPLRQASSLEQAFDIIKQARWLTPFRKGEWGVEQLNRYIEQWVFSRRVSDSNSGYSLFEGANSGTSNSSWYKGRVIMVTENHSASGLFNGDVGIVWTDTNGKLVAFFESASGEIKSMALARLPKVESAFAMTIHKSQGSEFDKPRLILPDPSQTSAQSWRIVSRALIYTAVTRAKKGLGVVSSQSALANALGVKQTRMSGLASRLASRMHEHAKLQD